MCFNLNLQEVFFEVSKAIFKEGSKSEKMVFNTHFMGSLKLEKLHFREIIQF